MYRYYLMAIEKGNTYAMNNLGVYYSNISCQETIKYF